MQETLLNASPRTKQRGKFKEKGFIAGVIYGDNMAASKLVKFDAVTINKILKTHGPNARVAVLYDSTQRSGFIREIQRDAISKHITHIDIQIVAGDQEVKMQIPIVFRGDEELAQRGLQLQIYRSEMTVTGKMSLIPESITVDASTMEVGDAITLKDLSLSSELKIGDKEDTLYGMISQMKVETETAVAGA